MAMNNVPHSLTMLTIGLVICFTIAHDSIPKHLQISSYYTASEDLTVCLDECEKRFLKDYPKSLDACKKRCREKHARQNTNSMCLSYCQYFLIFLRIGRSVFNIAEYCIQIQRNFKFVDRTALVGSRKHMLNLEESVSTNVCHAIGTLKLSF
ncbi:uncharacterized protein LOC107630139 isoform X2 [Arachis ipaensis]|uniref:uncharacterized protein LOC107630139 isoform X2 n=1 Tax=Arachis ipaensis TaxID=130454 RepID=UPI000A2B1505|nr:uncharacterized protein LOC107630139 isoform X2 [Arachis ipaensis]